MRSRFPHLVRWIVEPDEESGPENRTQQFVNLIRLGTRIAILLVTFMTLHKVILKVFRLPEEAYTGESILWECLPHRGIVLILALVLAGVLILVLPRLRQGWAQFESGASLRWFIGLLTAILAWACSTYAYNAYYDQFHLTDRVALVLLAALVFWRPIFTLPFVACLWAVIWQFNYPSIGFYIQEAEFKPLVKILTLFSAAFLIRAVVSGRRMNDFLFLTLCLVAANFWVPGYGKLSIGWITHGHLYYMFVASYTHGWLAFLEPDTVVSITRILAVFDWPMRIGTLLIEGGALFLFLHVRAAKWFLVFFTVLIGGFFLLFGFFFWKWMILHGALLILIFRQSDQASASRRRDLFTRRRFALSLVVIGASSIWFASPRLAWFDTPFANMTQYEAIGQSGATYDLPLSFFAPYNSHLAMAHFLPFLTPTPILTSPYGITYDRSLADTFLEARTPQDVIRIEGTRAGTSREDKAFAKQFDEFVRRTVTVSNRNAAVGRGSGFLSLIRPPSFLLTFAPGNPYRHEEPIVSVHVYRISSFFDGQNYTVFRRDLLRTIEIRQ